MQYFPLPKPSLPCTSWNFNGNIQHPKAHICLVDQTLHLVQTCFQENLYYLNFLNPIMYYKGDWT